MKTTLNLDVQLMRRLKQEAAGLGVTMTTLVEAALRDFLTPVDQSTVLPPLPVHHLGGAVVDVADRNSLHDAMNDIN